jgi:hypothetical protein
MKILVKFPTRSRPQKCYEVLKGYTELSKKQKDVHYLITYDNDDATMNEEVRNKMAALHPNVQLVGGYSSNKIHACNRNISDAKCKWDIILLASDDMICEQFGWDEVIRKTMTDTFPTTDGCLWFWDGDPATVQGNLCTMVIMGRKYFERFNYLYHPSYVSLWCDNEQTEVATILNKMHRSGTVLFRHVHPSNTQGMKSDMLMQRTQSYFNLDKGNYHKRKSINFGL